MRVLAEKHVRPQVGGAAFVDVARYSSPASYLNFGNAHKVSD